MIIFAKENNQNYKIKISNFPKITHIQLTVRYIILINNKKYTFKLLTDKNNTLKYYK